MDDVGEITKGVALTSAAEAHSAYDGSWDLILDRTVSSGLDCRQSFLNESQGGADGVG
jgi:hypothetical protein